VSLLAKGVIIEIRDASVGVVSPFFSVPKKTPGKFWPIVNMKYLNSFIRYEHFKMENLESVRSLFRKGDFMAKNDLKDAYFTFPIHPSQHKFLRFSWRKRVFQFCCMAFGLAPASRVFTKLLKLFVTFLRRLGIRLVIYLDDILFLNATAEGLRCDVKFASDLL